MASGYGLADSLVEGIGIPGTPNGGLVTVQGDPLGSAVPISIGQAGQAVVVTGGAAAAAVATLPAVVGQRHYVTHISIRRVATAALAGTAILAVTTTNFGGRSWRTGNFASVTVSGFDGAVLLDTDFVHALVSDVVNTPTVFTCPAPGAAVSWQVVIDYYTGA